jgi:hypothetical protein
MIDMICLVAKSKCHFIVLLITGQRLKGGGLILLSNKYLEIFDDGFSPDLVKDTSLRL